LSDRTLLDMASFFEELWNSVFTPGPTPTLLVATNASFACLQVLLLCLLLATYSVHFIVLSLLCGGLWWSINWFVVELHSAKVPNEADEAKQAPRPQESDKVPLGDSDTETEPTTGLMKPPPLRDPPTSLRPKPTEAEEALRKRRSIGDSSGYISTDSEWEKLSASSEKER
jgi:ER protein Pkr1